MLLLFSDFDIFSVLQHQQEQAKSEVNQIDQSVFEQVSDQELVRQLAAKYKLELPVLGSDKVYMSHREVDIDVSHDPMRLIFDRSEPFYVKGTEITVGVPFKGDGNFFRIRPATFTLSPLRAELEDAEIHLVYRRADNNAAAVKAQHEEAISSIGQNLAWLRESVASFNSEIGSTIQGLVAQRKQTLAARAEMVAAIGLPVREKRPVASGQSRAVEALAKSIRSPKKWDVFISYASEDKEEIARPLALALERTGLAVWFDELCLTVGDSLRASIDYGLANSRYGVVILSKSFFGKHWPAQELNGLASREVKGKKVLLPLWHKVGLDEVRSFSPMLADRIAAKSEDGLEALVTAISRALEDD